MRLRADPSSNELPILATVLGVFLVLGGCVEPAIEHEAPPVSESATPARATMTTALEVPPPAVGGPPAPTRFVVLGDTGTGEEGQMKVAAALYRVCSQVICDFALINGDNIYESGVTSVDDPQFETKFEVPYGNFTMPFWLVLGNHDNGDGLGTDSAKGDYQVQYSTRAARLSDKWHMPARYYSFAAGPIELFGLDTNTLVYLGDPLGQRDPLGETQAAWFDEAVSKSTALWKFSFAHHPYVSNGEHGNAGNYDGVPTEGVNVQTFYEDHVCGNVDFILAGHDHDLQWLQPVEACGATEFIVSGAGAKTRSNPGTTNSVHFSAGDTLGFAWIEIAGQTMTGRFYDADAKLLYERVVTKSTDAA